MMAIHYKQYIADCEKRLSCANKSWIAATVSGTHKDLQNSIASSRSFIKKLTNCRECIRQYGASMQIIVDIKLNQLPSSTDIHNYFVNDKAYTEDDVLVYNVFVYNIPKKTSKADFLRYFESFGHVVSVRIFHDYSKRVYRQALNTGFVNYKDPISAAKALKHSTHSINGKRLYVRACDSWHQPDAQPVATTDNAKNEMDTNEILLLNLNDNCLYIIFEQLEVHDQINLARSCCRLRDVFIMRARIEYKILDLEYLTNLTLWQTRLFFQMVGAQVHRLESHYSNVNFQRIVKFLGIYCVNVKSISITGEKLSAQNLKKLLKNMKLLEELYLIDVDLKNSALMMLKGLKHLKKLSLDKNYDLTGCNLMYLTTLESLSLNNCKSIVVHPYFKTICKNLTNLKYLDIEDCPFLQSSVADIVKHLHKLETLKLCGNTDQIHRIASLPSLKHLHLVDQFLDEPVPAVLFKDLSKNKASQLETLNIISYYSVYEETAAYIGELKKLKELQCPNNNLDDNCFQHIAKLKDLEMLNIKNCKGYTAMGLLNLIKNCKKLTTLNITNCKQLDEDFATKLLQLILSERKQRCENKPLKVIAINSGIPHYAGNTTAFQEASDILSISFDYEMDSVYLDSDSSLGSDIDEFLYDGEDDDYLIFGDDDEDRIEHDFFLFEF